MRGFAIVLLASVVVLLPQRASADTDLGTANAANWLVTVGGGGGGTPFSMNLVPGWPTSIAISSSGTMDGQWVPGASNATFNGFWAAKETFNIPAGATNVSLNFSNLGADDRCVLELNGNILGDYFMNAHPGPGVMSFTTAAVDVPYNFTFVTGGQITSGFRSGENELLLIVNNTGWYNQDSGTRILFPGDYTYASLDATLSYTVPEPSTFILLGIAGIGLIGFGWRMRVSIERRLLVPLAILISSALGTSDLFASPTYLAETGHFYEIVSYTGGWNDAKTQATSAGGYLVTITSSGEQQFIENLLINTGASTGGYWTDLIKSTSGNYVWDNGETLGYTHWDDGEPNNWNNNEDRGEMLWTKTSAEPLYSRRGYWNDLPENGIQLIDPSLTDIPISGYILEFNSMEFHNLTGCNFAGQNLTNADFSYANLTNANFQYANLTNAGLGSTTLTNANLTNANLNSAKLTAVDLTGATLTNADLTNADLSYANLANANLTGATLTNAGLGSTTLTNANLTNANLTGATMTAVDLTGATLIKANLSNANLSYSILSNANLTGATLTNARLGSTTLTNANLSNADLTSATMTAVDLTGATLTNANLTNANLSYSILSNANLTGATLTNARLGSTTLRNIILTNANLTSATMTAVDLTGATLTNANLTNANLFTANLTGADLRGAQGVVLNSTTTTNTITPCGTIQGLHLDSNNPTLLVRNYGDNIPIHIHEGMSMTSDSSLVFQFDGATWGSTISFDAGIPITLGGDLELGVACGVDPATLLGDTFDLFNWTGGSRSGQFANIINDLPGGYSWDTSHLYSLGEVSLVPEPSTLTLIAIGAISLIGFGWRRRTHQQ